MRTTSKRVVKLPSGVAVPQLGQGTWRMGEDPRLRSTEVDALRVGVDLGMTLIDCAEMYADGASEELVGVALEGRRDEVFLVSKVLPENATARGMAASCEKSLRRLRTDRLDLYLLHWRGNVPLEETVEGFEALIRTGKILRWGVSNFDVADMHELLTIAGGSGVEVNQVLYNLAARGIEHDLMAWCHRRCIAIMAYSPIDQARLAKHPAVAKVAARHGVTPAQIALAWVLRRREVIAIPKAATEAHVRENFAALEIDFHSQDLLDLDHAFPPPTKKVPLAML